MTNYSGAPVIRGMYPTGISWQAVELDKGRVRIVTDDNERQTSSIWVRPASNAEFQNRVYWNGADASPSLNYIFTYLDRAEFPEFVAWIEKVVTPDVLLAKLRAHYRWCHKSWQNLLIVEAPLVSLDDVVEWLGTTDMRKQDDGSWLYVEEEYDGGDLYRHRSLRLFYMAEDMDPYLLLVCRDYLDSDEDMVTTPIRSVGALKECLAEDTTTSAMLKALTNFDELERRLV